MTTTPPTVSFRQMSDGTIEDYELLDKLEQDYARGLPDRIMNTLAALEDGLSGYQLNRLEHSLQSATRARRDGADIDWVISALVHDIGDDLSPFNHDSYAATILQPYVREECTWVVRHHGIFQYAYYGDKVGKDPEARQKYRESPHYEAAVQFCERWDQKSFDPDYKTDALETFRADVRSVFSREPWAEENLRPGVKLPLVTV